MNFIYCDLQLSFLRIVPHLNDASIMSIIAKAQQASEKTIGNVKMLPPHISLIFENSGLPIAQIENECADDIRKAWKLKSSLEFINTPLKTKPGKDYFNAPF